MRRSKIGIVVDRNRILPEPPRRLHQDHHVAGLQRGCDDLTVSAPSAVHEQLTGRLTPCRSDRRNQIGRELREPPAVGLCRDAHRLAGELLVCEPLGILSASRN